jgi:hypothetical protein
MIVRSTYKRRVVMDDQNVSLMSPQRLEPWNKGKLTGAKPPLRPKHMWSIRSKLESEGRIRDLAMFNLAIDSGFDPRRTIASIVIGLTQL